MIAVECCEECGAPFEFTRKFRGEISLPTCDCEEGATEARVDRMIEDIKARRKENDDAATL